MVIIQLREWIWNGFSSSEILSLSHTELSSRLNRPAPVSRGCFPWNTFLLGWFLLHVMGSFIWAKPLAPLERSWCGQGSPQTHSALGAAVSWFKAKVTLISAIPSLGHSTWSQSGEARLSPTLVSSQVSLGINHKCFGFSMVINLRAAKDNVHNSGF